MNTLALIAGSLYLLGLVAHVHFLMIGKLALRSANSKARTRSDVNRIHEKLQPEINRLLKWSPLWPVVWARVLYNLLKK